jgi:hypothetical protein
MQSSWADQLHDKKMNRCMLRIQQNVILEGPEGEIGPASFKNLFSCACRPGFHYDGHCF